MDTTVTIKTRTILMTLLVMMAVLVAYFIGSTGGGSATAAAAESGDPATDAPHITMSGTGEATGVPDQLQFGLTVSESADDVSSALASASSTTRRILSALADLGIDTKDVQTTGLSVRPQYDYSGTGPAVLTGYGASESLSVLVRSLPDAGDAITAAVEAGGNTVRVHGVSLSIGDSDALLAEARDAAVAEAQAKAQQYADATGSDLGAVISIKEISASPPVAQPLAYRAVADSASVPIRAGSEDLKVTVSIVWSLG